MRSPPRPAAGSPPPTTATSAGSRAAGGPAARPRGRRPARRRSDHRRRPAAALSRHGVDANPALPSVPVSSSQTSRARLRPCPPRRPARRSRRLAAHPVDLRRSGARRRRRRQRRLAGRGAAPRRLPDRRDLADRRGARGLRRVAVGRPRRPRRARLRPPRRAAGRPAGALGAPAVRAHRRRRPGRPELHARGAIDDKGNVAFHLLGMRAHLAATGRDTPAVTVKLLIEGEEESGSPHFAALLRESADRLDCDVVVVSDTGMAAPGPAQRRRAMRGLADAEITLRGRPSTCTPARSAAPSPTRCTPWRTLLAALHDEQGRVTLPGFYDKVRPLTDRERELMARVPFDEQEWLAGPGRVPGRHRRGGLQHPGADRRPADRRGQRHVGRLHRPRPQDDHPGRGAREGQLPAGRRPAPEDVGPQVRAWVEANSPEGIEAEVETPPGGVSPCASDLDSPAMAALLTAIAQAWDSEPDDVLYLRRAAAGPRPTWSRSSARRWSSSAPGCPPTASTRRTSGCSCRCSTAAPRRPPTCGGTLARDRYDPRRAVPRAGCSQRLRANAEHSRESLRCCTRSADESYRSRFRRAQIAARLNEAHVNRSCTARSTASCSSTCAWSRGARLAAPGSARGRPIGQVHAGRPTAASCTAT